MKILVQVGVDLIPSNGGIHKSTLQFSEAFGGSPILSFTQQGEIPGDLDRAAPIRHFPLSKNKILEWYGYAPRVVRREAEKAARCADLLCCNIMLRHHACWTRSLARDMGVPYWFVTHGQLDPHVYTYRAGVKRLWLKLFGRSILNDAAHVIFSTEREREKAKWFHDGENCRVVHWPVELFDLSGKVCAKTQICERLGLSPDVRLLLFLGRLHSGKRVLETINAFAAARVEETHLLLVGPDGDISAADCKQRAREQKLSDRVHVVGPAYGSDKERLLLGADAYISLSEKENFGHTVAESLSAQNPVILSPGNDLSYELRKYRCGFFLEDDTIETAAAAIKSLAQLSEGDLKLMGSCGRAFAEQKLSFEVFREKLQELAIEATQKNT